ncbi:thap domain-containing protein 4 [Lasius niger]|uniref:Thap domain-containing protein 4 n=1 Tax=Lasius niger TaxID=67767 RepID=A0A0J7K4E8_LASNI|nr:thap domain-containing protein 4 [Lasius niger]
MCSFPKDKELQNLWITNMGRSNWQPRKDSSLCEVHFDNAQWEKVRVDGTKKLKWKAVPTIFGEAARIKTELIKNNRQQELPIQKENNTNTIKILELPVNKDIIELSVNKDIIELPVIKDVIELPVNKDIIELPVNKDIIKLPVNKDVIELPVNKDIIELPVNKDIIKLPVNKDIIEILELPQNNVEKKCEDGKTELASNHPNCRI